MFIDMWKVKYAVSMSNCTDALHVCCVVCGFGPGDEVICPSLTFAASCNCIRYVGATPVFADIVGPDHINIDPKDIERKITPKTKGVIVVHMAGFPAQMDEIMKIARKHNLKVIEDACNGPLSEYKGRKLGTIGDCAAFSFFSNKNISTGEGGMFITNSEELEKKARLIRSHGMSTMSYQRASGHATEYDITCLGYNYRMDDIRAAIAIEQLNKLQGDLEARVAVRKRYIENLSKNDRIVVPFADCEEFTSNYIFPIIINQVGNFSAMVKYSSAKECAVQLNLPDFTSVINDGVVMNNALFGGFQSPMVINSGLHHSNVEEFSTLSSLIRNSSSIGKVFSNRNDNPFAF
jgi:dTDP-4-amino-4,6-dideoxygalactose transaminase